MTHRDRELQGDQVRERKSGAVGMVERLIEAAGSGPAIPPDGAARLKQALRPVWRQQVAERHRRERRLWAAGLAAAAALVLAAVYVGTLRDAELVTASRTMTVATVRGRLEVTAPGSPVAVLTPDEVGAEFPLGSLLRTRDGNRAGIRLPDGDSLRLDHSTVARLESETSIVLESGAIYIDSDGESPGGLEVRTPFGRVQEIGTQFEVRLTADRVDLRVREGEVSLTRGSDVYQISHGVTLSVDHLGRTTPGTITSWDPAWDWTQEAAPPFEIEGRSVLAFLDWYSSETGRSIRFADSDLERFAATTVLHGSLEGVSVAESPAALLPSCRLAMTEAPGSIVIHRLGDEP